MNKNDQICGSLCFLLSRELSFSYYLLHLWYIQEYKQNNNILLKQEMLGILKLKQGINY